MAVAEYGDPNGIQRLEDRVNRIARGSKEDADMKANIEKTVALHVRAQDQVSPTSPSEAKSICKYRCPHLNCGFQFLTQHGLKVHAGQCKWKDEFEVEEIVGHRGPTVARQYKIRWKGYGPDYDTFERRNNVHPELISEYEKAKGVYVYDWRFRCDVCDLPCSSERGISIHKSKMHKEDKVQNFKGSLADEAVKICKIIDQQSQRPVIYCEGAPLDNSFRSKYLGIVFTADAQQKHDVKERIARALTRCGQLRHIFNSPDLPLVIKLRLYQPAVCSIITYGCESWLLNPVVLKMLNGANSRMLASGQIHRQNNPSRSEEGNLQFRPYQTDSHQKV